MPSAAKNVKAENNIGEKSGYEKFEAELKETIFAVIFLLVKEEEESLWSTVLDAMIEAAQLLSFPFLSVITSLQ